MIWNKYNCSTRPCTRPRLRHHIRAYALARPGSRLRSILALMNCQGKTCPEKTESPIFKAEEHFVNLSFAAIEKKELPALVCIE